MQRFNIYLRQHSRVLRETFMQLLRAPVAGLLTVAVIGITLALPTGLYLAIDNLQRLSTGWDTGGQISLFLKLDTSEAAAERLADRVRRMRGVARVEYLSRAQALAEFKRLSGFGEALNALDQNPLPAVLIVHPGSAASKPEALQALLNDLRQHDIVDSAQLDLEWVRRLRLILTLAERAVLIIAGLLGLAVLLTIGNTIRLAVLNRRDEIEVMKLLGGTNGFIRRPFLYAGVLQGLLGAATAWAILTVTLMFLAEPLAELGALYGSDFRVHGLGFTASALLLGIGALLGWIGSRLAVGRHLRAIEPT
ncbi:MAG: cell division protein FtsX [Gammaproteobacteria bacterium]|nr:cell division protein FtsX [Gammaproteobacteria bacterium]